MSYKTAGKKILSVFLCFVLTCAFMALFKQPAKAYDWPNNFRYKTTEGGEWIYINYDPLQYYDGHGYMWVDFYGNDLNAEYDLGAWHKNVPVYADSTLIFTKSSPVQGQMIIWNYNDKSNLFTVQGGTIIVGEGIEFQNGGGRSAIALENNDNSKAYVAGRVRHWSNSAPIWTDRDTSVFYNMGTPDERDDNVGVGTFRDTIGPMTTINCYKLSVNKGTNVTNVTSNDYLFYGREFEPYLANGAHFYTENTNHPISCDVQTGYHFTNWTGSATYNTQSANANFSGLADRTLTANAEIDRFNAKFVNGDSVVQNSDWDYGTTPVYSGQTPVKPADAQYTYTFTGWSPEPSAIYADQVYTAQYSSTVNKYNITFKNGSEVLQSSDWDYGETPVYSGQIPTKPADAQYTYTFSGWDSEISPVTGEKVYTAQFSTTVNNYNVTWRNYDLSILETDENVPYGTTPEYNGETPVKPATAQYTYTFSGWDPEVSGITGNTVYTAQFTETLNKYTVVWKNENGTVLETDENVPYGTMPEFNGETPVKAADAQFTYTFDSWSPNVSDVTGNVEYTATYTSTVNKYVVKFMNGTQELQSTEYNYGATPAYTGETPTKPADAQYTYTFSGWSPAIEPVTKAAVYTAQFSNGTNAYTITFKNGDTVLQSSDWDYGETPAYSGTPTKDFDSVNHYTFSGWDPAITSVTQAAEYSAQFTSEAHSLTYSYDSTDHWQVCDCGYATEKSAHVLDEHGACVCGYVNTQKADYTAVEEAIESAPQILVYYTDSSVSALTDAIDAVEYDLYSGRQADVNQMAANINTAVSGLRVKQYNVSVSGEGCTISQSLPANAHYYLAIARAPKTNSAGDYFTYWKDGEGNIVGTYRNYAFYVVKDTTLTAVFTAPAAYEEARKDAVISSRALDAKTNPDGTVVVFAEHSVSSTESRINGHGVIVTTNSSLANEGSMVRGTSNEEIHDFMAKSSSSTLTGIVEAHAQLTGSTVWVRTYVIDKNGDEKYGEIKSFSINAGTHSADEEIMLDGESLDLTELNEGNDAPAAVDEPAEENTDIVSTVIDMLKNIITRIINYVKFALAILK